jgi:hypothetical protein
MLRIARGWWQESPITRETTKETVKTIAQETPGCPALPVVTCSCAFFSHARLRVRPAPGVSCTLFFARVLSHITRTRSAPRECEVWLFEIQVDLPPHSWSSCAGSDPRIHHLQEKPFAKRMGCRVIGERKRRRSSNGYARQRH